MAKTTTLIQLQDALIAKLLHGRNAYQGLAVACYTKQATKLGYDDKAVRRQVNQCDDMVDLLRHAQKV